MTDDEYTIPNDDSVSPTDIQPDADLRGADLHGADLRDANLRDAWMPQSVEPNVRRFGRERDRATGDPWIQASTSSIRRWVREAAETVAESDPQADRWRAVSSHDLRRSWAPHHLVER